KTKHQSLFANQTKMVGCVAFGCTNSSTKGFKVYSFPTDPERSKLWEIKVRRVGWKPTPHSKLCEVSVHYYVG
ncbi:THAP domain-containing protein, partial [Gelidibacter salicanalis]|nr:THAP domain-containing protein [Gelidibacter salicanalis]